MHQKYHHNIHGTVDEEKDINSKGHTLISLNSHILASFLSLQHLSLPLDRLPYEFLNDILSRDLADLYVAFLPLDLISSCEHKDVHSTTLNNSSRITPSFPLIIGGVLIVNMVNWSRIKDAEFALRRIANVFSIFSSHAFRSVGIGSALLDLALTEAVRTRSSEESSLEVRKTNIISQNLYTRKGFQNQSEEVDYYEFGENCEDRTAIEMALPLHLYRPSKRFQEGEITLTTLSPTKK